MSARKPSRTLGWGLAATCVVYAWVRFASWAPRPLGAGIEASWRLAVHEAWLQGLAFGRELIFTSGPYGFAYARILHPATHGLTLLLQVALATVVVGSLWRLLGAAAPHPVARAAVTLLGIEAMATSYEGFYYTALLLPLCTLVWPGDGRAGRERLLLHLQVATAALVALMKFSFGFAFAWVMGAVVAASLARRRLPAPALTGAVCLLGLWLAAGQRLADVPGYLEASLRLSAGYGAAMALPGPPAEALLFAVTALGVAIGFGLSLPRDRPRDRALATATLAAFLLLGFKAVYTRHDLHAFAGVSILTPLALLIGGRLLRHPGAATRGVALACLAGATALAGQTFSRDDPNRFPHSINRFGPARVASQAAAMGAVLAGRFDAERAWQAEAARLRSRFPIPRRSGRYDVYPVSQSVPIAHGLLRSPRPVLQSYAAYTPWLLERNARHLRGERAPQHLLFAVAPVDGRYPAQEDSLSWIEVLTRYRARGLTPHFAELRRAARVRSHAREPLGEARVRFGAPVSVPEAGASLIWVEIDVAPSAFGRALGLLYKLPSLFLEVGGPGVESRGRLVPGIARAGFLLSPRVGTTAEFATLVRDPAGAARERAVSQLRVTGPDPAAGPPIGYRDTVEIRFFRLRLGARGDG